MKWIILDNKYINVANCTDVVFTDSECGNEYKVFMRVCTINNTFSSTYYSKVDKLSMSEVEDRFYEFIMDNDITVFNFHRECKRIEVNNS